MKALILSVATAIALLGFGGTASAQYGQFQGGHGHGPGHYHVVPAHLHYHATPFGGHYDYHGPSLQYHRGPDIIPLQPYGYPTYGYGGYRARPGVAFGFSFIR